MRGELLYAVGRIRAAWPILVDGMALARERGEATDTTPERLAYLDRRARDDRAARFAAIRDHQAPTGPIAAPAAPSLLDARALIDTTVTDCAAELHRAVTAEAIRSRAQHTDDRVRLGLDIISTAARYSVATALSAVWVERLYRAGDVAEREARIEPYRVKVPRVDCPACEMATVWLSQGSPVIDEWVALCDYRRCECRGPACPCGRVDRTAGRRHVWARDEWSTLRALAA